ncbi:hypothetical protein L6R52_27860 [Myxococcota bacterium]|nr:hypothetical protein [Myxococcota bacterium]
MIEALLVALAVLTPREVDLPGTQPNELADPPQPSSACNCHLSFAETFTEPGQTYRATAMALAARDPLFRAALRVAADDHPELADLCIRCHAPVGWLSGRSSPGDGSALTEEDLESITCDTCHRMIPTPSGEQLIGSGQYSISPDANVKRAGRGNRPENGHTVEASSFIASAELCGQCHSLFNPAERAHGPDGRVLDGVYYEQRTYEEWKGSVFAQPGGKTCIDCHMPRVAGKAARQGAELTDLWSHAIVGGNDFVARAVNILDPTRPFDADLAALDARVDESLRSAAKLELVDHGGARVVEGEALPIAVRLTNLTGHKLPTGYPEGRRVYLEVLLALPGTATITISGRWDSVTGVLIKDEQLRSYETEHGRVEGGQSVRTRHLLQMNQIISDTRLPPEGFVPEAEDMVPAGRSYGPFAPYRHWDDVAYSITAPEVSGTVTGTVTIRARYMITDGHVVDFLTSTLGPSRPEAVALRTAFIGLAHLPPRVMAEVSFPIVVEERPPPPPPPPPVVPEEDGGCTCVADRASPSLLALLLGALALTSRASARATRPRALRAPSTRTPRR